MEEESSDSTLDAEPTLITPSSWSDMVKKTELSTGKSRTPGQPVGENKDTSDSRELMVTEAWVSAESKVLHISQSSIDQHRNEWWSKINTTYLNTNSE